MKSIEENTNYNRLHYDNTYNSVNISSIVNKVNDLDSFLASATTTDTSWVCMYYGDFRENLKGKKVLELGCGDCTNACVLAALGAEVWANDISDKSGEIIDELNIQLNLGQPIKFLKGDFLQMNIDDASFDIVIGKAFLHHLTHEQEIQFLDKITNVLKPDGFARFVEPAINNNFIDFLRWLVPMDDRPSSLQRKRFKKWKDLDPHPVRNNSGEHYKKTGEIYFENVELNSVGMFERFYRLFPNAKWSRPFRKKALAIETYVPKFFRYIFARTQTIDYYGPKK